MSSRQKLVIICLQVAHMSDHRKPNHLLIKRFGRGGPADPPTVFEAGMLRYNSVSSSGAAGKKLPYPRRELVQVATIRFFSASRLPLPAALPDLLVCQTLLFRFLQRLRFNQQALPFIALSGAAPHQHNGSKGRMLAGASGQSHIPGREEKKMVQIGARQT